MSGETIPVVRALIDELEANRSIFEALCVACGRLQMGRIVPGGRWTVLEHVAHVASYDALAIQQIEHARLLQAGPSNPVDEAVAPNGPALPDADVWNEAEVARRAGRTTQMHVAEMEGMRE